MIPRKNDESKDGCRPAQEKPRLSRNPRLTWKVSSFVAVGVLLANQCILLQALPWGKSDGSFSRYIKPSFLSRLNARVTFEWNFTDKKAAAQSDDETDLDEDSETNSNDAFQSIKERLLAATKNNTLTNALAEQLDSFPSIKGILQRGFYAETDQEDSDFEDDDTLSSEESLYARLLESTWVNTVTEQLRSMRESISLNATYDQEMGEIEKEINNGFQEYTKGIGERLLASTANNSLASALADQIRSMPTVREFLKRNLENSTVSFDLVGAVSTSRVAHRRETTGVLMRGGDGLALDMPGAYSSPATGLDRVAQGFCRNMAKIVAMQCLATWLRSRERNWIEQLADRLLSEESAIAVRTIRTILANMEDHGIVDVFSKYSSQQVAASVYALYRLQRAAIRHETIEQLQPDRHPPDLLQVLEDLSHYAVYANAAYGWKMDLAFQGKLHMGDERALLRKTGIQKEDIVKLNLKSKAHLPVYFLARDHQRKTLVLCIRGTWSAHDVLTDLCCTAEEYQGPLSSTTTSSWSATKRKEQRYVAHKGMLEAAMAVAIEMEDIIEEELEANPGYSLVLVGHSMGGGCCSLLATFWEHKFNNLRCFLFGGPCVAPMDSSPTNKTSIINVISEGDPFRCISLGHIADISAAVARLCEEPNLRRTILKRTEGHVHEMEADDLEYCWEIMEGIRHEVMTHSDKMFPPGRIFHVMKQHAPVSQASSIDYDSDTEDEPDFDDSSSSTSGVVIHEVGPEYFRELVIGPRMLDVSRHLPSLYEDRLRSLLESETFD